MPPVDLHHVITESPASGSPLVLGSSLGTTTAMWDPQLPPLAGHGDVIRYDHRGHGASPAPAGPYAIADLGSDVVRLLDRLELDRASIGGVSLGAMVAMWVAAHAPERVARLVLCCTSAHMGDTPWTERAAAVRSAGSAEPVADGVVRRWLTPAFAVAHPEVRAWLRSMLVATSAEAYAACCEALGGMDLREDLERIRAPTIVIGAHDDPATPLAHQRDIAERIPRARLELVAGAAHLANVERPEEVTRLMLDHLDTDSG